MSSETKREKTELRSSERGGFEPAPGTIVAGKYRIDSTLGEGGMGVIFAATHIDLEQKVAIKFLLPGATRSPVAVERFMREARAAAKVRSEYVARVHDVGTLEGVAPYIVMEHLEGSDLGKLIDTEGPRPIDEVCEIALQACEALAEVHAAGIVHRDLKPSNLFVTRHADGSPAVKLLDFGISKLTLGTEDAPVDPVLTTTATIMGSPAYMSPEQIKSTKEVDSRTDVWSLGAVLYESTTGRQAFHGESVPQVCALIASETPEPPSSLREGIPPELDRGILGCLEKDPDKRITLIALAAILARYAPARASPSLDRIGAMLGPGRPSPRPSGEWLPVLPLASLGARGVISSWRKERTNAPRARNLLLLLGGVAGSVLGVGLFSERLHARHPQDSSSALSAASSLASSEDSMGTAAPSASLEEAGAGAEEESEGDDDAEAVPSAAPSLHSSARPVPLKPHTTKSPRHPTKLLRRRGH